MTFFSSKTFISIVLAILVILNLALLGTLWWQNNHAPLPDEQDAVKTSEGKPSFFEKNLSLTDEQLGQFNALRLQHFRGTLPALVTISNLKKQLIEEAIQSEPDTLLLKTIAGKIGKLQAIEEYRLAWHFNSLSKVCTPEQRDSLQMLLVEVTAKPFKLKQRLVLKLIQPDETPQGTTGPRVEKTEETSP